jgi:hypothetical protein
MARRSTVSKNHFPILVLLIALAAQAQGDDYADARAEMFVAYQNAEFPAMRVAARKALAARPGYPGALFNLALAQALDEDPVASLLTLRDLLSVGVDFGVADIPEFAGLKTLLEWRDYSAAVERLYEPAGFAEVVAELETPDFVPEGIAADADGRFYLGSIRYGKLVRLGDPSETLSTPEKGHWSIFGIRMDDRGGLWFASAAVAQFADVESELGRSGLFRYDLESGSISERAILPPSDDAQVLGDLVLAPNGSLYTTDSLTGVLYRYEPGSEKFDVVVDRGVFGSPQGLAIDDSGKYLYVADYIGGLYRVRLTTASTACTVTAANSSLFRMA